MAKSSTPWNGRDATELLQALELHQAELEAQKSELQAQNLELRDALERLAALNVGLAAARDRYRALYEGVPTPFVTVDREHAVLEANAAAEALFGAPRPRLVGARIEVFIGELHRRAFRAFVGEVFAAGRARSRDLQVTAPGADAAPPIDVLIDGVVIPGPDGGAPHAVLGFVDISARLHQEHARRKAQDDVLGIVSHDLRGPLNAIVLACDALKADVAPAVHALHVAAIEKAAVRCVRLIKDLLRVVHIESGSFVLDRTWFDLGELVRVLASDHRAAATAAGVELSVVIGPGRLMVLADRDRVHQIGTNLVTNALAHGKGAPIEISASDRGGSVVLAVSDQGPGIPLTEQGRVFDRFRQGGRVAGGAGLGLTIVKGLVAAHRGTVTVTSTPGLGARFEVTLPRGGEALEAEHGRDAPRPP